MMIGSFCLEIPDLIAEKRKYFTKQIQQFR